MPDSEQEQTPQVLTGIQLAAAEIKATEIVASKFKEFGMTTHSKGRTISMITGFHKAARDNDEFISGGKEYSLNGIITRIVDHLERRQQVFKSDDDKLRNLNIAAQTYVKTLDFARTLNEDQALDYVRPLDNTPTVADTQVMDESIYKLYDQEKKNRAMLRRQEVESDDRMKDRRR